MSNSGSGKTNTLGMRLNELLDEARRTYREPKNLMDFDAMRNRAVSDMATLLMRKAAEHFDMADRVEYPVVAVTARISSVQPNLAAASYHASTNVLGVNRLYLLDEKEAATLGPMLGEESFHWLDAQAHALAGKRYERGTLAADRRMECIGFAGRNALWQIVHDDPTYEHSRIFPSTRPTYDTEQRAYVLNEARKYRTDGKSKSWLRTLRRMPHIPFLSEWIQQRLDPDLDRRMQAMAHHLGYKDGEAMTIEDLEKYFENVLSEA